MKNTFSELTLIEFQLIRNRFHFIEKKIVGLFNSSTDSAESRHYSIVKGCS